MRDPGTVKRTELAQKFFSGMSPLPRILARGQVTATRFLLNPQEEQLPLKFAGIRPVCVWRSTGELEYSP